MACITLFFLIFCLHPAKVDSPQTNTATYLRLRSPSALQTSAWLWWPWSGPPWSEADQSLGQGVGGSQTYSASPGRETVDTEFKGHPRHFKDFNYPKPAEEVWHLFVFTVCGHCIHSGFVRGSAKKQLGVCMLKIALFVFLCWARGTHGKGHMSLYQPMFIYNLILIFYFT